MKKIVVDSCTIILLAKATILSTFANTHTLITTKDVYEEVLKGKEKSYPDALLLEKIKREGKIEICKPNEKLCEKIKRDYTMGAGEASLIAFVISEREMIVATDNLQGRKAAKIFALPLVGSIEIVVSLYKKNSIPKEKAREALRTLREEGWFYDFLIEKALEEIQ